MIETERLGVQVVVPTSRRSALNRSVPSLELTGVCVLLDRVARTGARGLRELDRHDAGRIR